MNSIIKYLSGNGLIVSFLVFFSCNQNGSIYQAPNPIVNELTGQQILIYGLSDQVILDRNKIKLISVINSSCSPCLEDLQKFSNWYKQFKEDVQFIFYYSGPSINEMRSYDNDYFDGAEVMIFDNSFIFLKINKLNELNSFYHTLLLDKNNRVILAGNPLRDYQVGVAYRNEIFKFSLTSK